MTRSHKNNIIVLAFLVSCSIVFWRTVDRYRFTLEASSVWAGIGHSLTQSQRNVQAGGHGNGMDKAHAAQSACNFPVFDIFSPEIMKFYVKSPTISCPKFLPTITSYNGVAIKVNQTYKFRMLGSQKVICWYRTVEYQRRVDFFNGEWQGPFQESIPVPGRPEFVEVQCENDEGETVSKMHHYIVREAERQREKAPNPSHSFTKDQMNVLVLGMDSLSTQLFQRAMPKTRQYLLETLKAVEMKKYNKIGDNTFPNLLAISAGVFVEDLKTWSMSEGYDRVPFLWKEFKRAGYYTQYVTDRADFDDFATVPTDSYNVPMLRALMRNKMTFDNDCFEDKIEVKLWFGLHMEFARESIFRKGRYFTVGMLKRPTHDFPDKASAVDEHYFNFFKEMQETGLLDNTLVVFFGDHGPRTGKYRNTFFGSIEERTPNMVFYLPPWFRDRYPNYYQNLQYNAEMLTSNFDIHATLQSLISFSNKSSTKSTVVYNSETNVNRAHNLFTKVPSQRTCADASVPPHFCMCNGGLVLPKSGSIQKIFGEQVVKDINAKLHPKLSLCVRLKLKTVMSVAFLEGEAGGDGMYRVMLKTEPGDAMFEATVQYTVRLYFFTNVQILGMISRVNMYRGQSDCVEEDKTLRMYCYCKNVLKDIKPEVTAQTT